MYCGDARENRDAEATYHVVRTTAALTKPQKKTFWLMGMKAHELAASQQKFLLSLTATQAVRLSREKWIESVESVERERFVVRPKLVKLPALRTCENCGRTKNNAYDACKCTMMGDRRL